MLSSSFIIAQILIQKNQNFYTSVHLTFVNGHLIQNGAGTDSDYLLGAAYYCYQSTERTV